MRGLIEINDEVLSKSSLIHLPIMYVEMDTRATNDVILCHIDNQCLFSISLRCSENNHPGYYCYNVNTLNNFE